LWFPATVAVPAAVPPEEQSDGADACGPNTLNVTVPLGDKPPDSPATDEIAVPAAPDDGAVIDKDVETRATVVFGIDAPHAEADGLLPGSPP
jgi:hypothetical protein